MKIELTWKERVELLTEDQYKGNVPRKINK
jgi:hypothetical protein